MGQEDYGNREVGPIHLIKYVYLADLAFAEFTEVYQIESEFQAKVEAEFNKMIEGIVKSET